MSAPLAAEPGAVTLSRDQIIDIARRDARRRYRDLGPYDVVVTEHDKTWRVAFNRISHHMRPGPAYVISAAGKIIAKTYRS